MHSFHAYIDEAGDEGFAFGKSRDTGSSEWFVVSAIVIRQTNLAIASAELKRKVDSVLANKKIPFHFVKLKHDQRVAITHALSKLPIKVIAVCVNKRELQPGHGLQSQRRLYRYVTRYLLERISWLTRRESLAGQPLVCGLHFSKSHSMSYDDLFDYLALLRFAGTEIAWPHLDTQNITVKAHDESLWLKAADIAASGVAQALEINRYGLCEDRFVRLLHPVVYHRNNNYRSYGMKLFPKIPAVQPERDNRYSWLSLFP